jgi:hypothetical protein
MTTRGAQMDFDGGLLHVRKARNRTPSTRPLLGDERRRCADRQREAKPSPLVFGGGRGSPFTPAGLPG